MSVFQLLYSKKYHIPKTPVLYCYGPSRDYPGCGWSKLAQDNNDLDKDPSLRQHCGNYSCKCDILVLIDLYFAYLLF